MLHLQPTPFLHLSWRFCRRRRRILSFLLCATQTLELARVLTSKLWPNETETWRLLFPFFEIKAGDSTLAFSPNSTLPSHSFALYFRLAEYIWSFLVPENSARLYSFHEGAFVTVKICMVSHAYISFHQYLTSKFLYIRWKCIGIGPESSLKTLAL